MIRKNILWIILSLLTSFPVLAGGGSPKGKLFIIGGGERGEELIKTMISESNLTPDDYIMVLPMSSELPVESTEAIAKQFQASGAKHISSINFDRAMTTNLKLVDSVRRAKLIFITGGDQNRFMSIVKDSELYTALHQAYQQGSLIAGTSAGAAIMSEKMITGKPAHSNNDRNPFGQLKHDIVEISEGMGFLKNAIVDQHFIARSRYTRLFSTLASYPKLAAIGIDEGTALLVYKNKATVIGKAQVLVVKNPRKLTVSKTGYISWDKVDFGLYTDRQQFKLN